MNSPPKRRHEGKTVEDAKKLRANNSQSGHTPTVIITTPLDPDYNATHPRLAFLTYTHLNGTGRFEDFIFPALETWHPDDGIPLFVTISDVWKPAYHDLIHTKKDPNFLKYQHRMHIVWVTCGEGKTFEPECCKQEQGMLYMLDHGYDRKFDWIIYLDDDNYIRTNYLRQYLSTLPTDQLLILTSGPQPRFLGVFGYLPQKSPYKCSKDPQYQYPWGQVIAYNQATLKHIEKGIRLGGLTKQCREFEVFHDVGNALFHWMYQLPEIHLLISDRPNEMRRELMGCHGIGRCFGSFTCFMDEVHSQLSAVWYSPPKKKDYTYEWRNFTGYRTTNNYKTFGDPSEWNQQWHTMPIPDCLGPTQK